MMVEQAPALSPVVRIALPAMLLVVFLSRISWNIADPDIWHEMALFRYVLSHGGFPLADPFAYTPVLDRFIHHEWGAGALAFYVSGLFGSAGILVFRDLVALLTGFVAFRCARRQGARMGATAAVAFLCLLLGETGFSPIRAQIYTFLFTAGELYFLARDREGSRWWIACWLPLFVIWVNLHGGFVIGIVFVAAEWLERAVRRESRTHLVAVAGAMAALVAVNPYGLAYYGFLWRALTMARPHIAEWDPLWRRILPLEAAALAPLLALTGYAVWRTGWRGARGIAILAVAVCGGLLHNRLLPVCAIAFVCSVPVWLKHLPLGATIEAMFRKRAVLVMAMLAAAGFGAVFAHRRAWMPWQLKVPGAPLAIAESHIYYPVGAAEYLAQAGFRGNVMVPFDHGSYLTWKLYPDVRVSMDSRYEVAFPNWLVEENVRFYAAEQGWEAVLTRYPTDLVLVPLSTPLAQGVARSGWTRVYSDRAFEIWSRPGLALTAMNRNGQPPEGSLP